MISYISPLSIVHSTLQVRRVGMWRAMEAVAILSSPPSSPSAPRHDASSSYGMFGATGLGKIMGLGYLEDEAKAVSSLLQYGASLFGMQEESTSSLLLPPSSSSAAAATVSVAAVVPLKGCKDLVTNDSLLSSLTPRSSHATPPTQTYAHEHELTRTEAEVMSRLRCHWRQHLRVLAVPGSGLASELAQRNADDDDDDNDIANDKHLQQQSIPSPSSPTTCCVAIFEAMHILGSWLSAGLTTEYVTTRSTSTAKTTYGWRCGDHGNAMSLEDRMRLRLVTLKLTVRKEEKKLFRGCSLRRRSTDN